MPYIVKAIDTATASNPNFAGETRTFYYGKGGDYPHRMKECCDPWPRKYFADKFIEKQIENDKYFDADRGYWTHSYEVIEIAG